MTERRASVERSTNETNVRIELTLDGSGTATAVTGLPFVVHEVYVPTETIGTFDSGLTEDFVRAFATAAEMTVHVRLVSGRSPHHVVEAEFKALATCLRWAVAVGDGDVPSTKGTLS